MHPNLNFSAGYGQDGTQTDGFRKPLRDRLREDGYQVNMVGSQ